MKHFLQGKRARNAIDQSEHDNAPADLQLRVLVQFVEHNLGNSILLEFDDDIDGGISIGAVMDIGNLGQLLVANKFAELLHEISAIHLVRNLGDDDRLLAVFAFDDFMLRANRQIAAAGLVRIENALFAHDNATGRKIRTRQNGHEFLGRNIRVVEHHACGINGLAKVMGWNIRRHADSDTIRAIHKEVGKAGGKHRRLLQAFVVVGIPIHGLFIEVAQQFHGRFGQARFGVAHCCGGVAVNRAEVAMAIDEWNAHGKILREANHGVVHGGIAMRVIFANNIANRAGRFAMRPIRGDAAVVHRVQDSTMHGLQAIANVRQGARNNNAHRIFEERGAHLMAEFGLLYARRP